MSSHGPSAHGLLSPGILFLPNEFNSEFNSNPFLSDDAMHLEALCSRTLKECDVKSQQQDFSSGWATASPKQRHNLVLGRP